MKLSGHNYDNDIFASLLDGLKDDIVLNKKAEEKKEPKISSTDVFSSTTQEVFNNIQEEELQDIASELQFAADRAKVALDAVDLAKFAQGVKRDGT